MVSLIERKISGKVYYYLEKNVKIAPNKWKKISLSMGTQRPKEKEIKEKTRALCEKEKQVMQKYFDDLLKNFNYEFLSRKQLIEIEKSRNNFLARFEKLSRAQKESFRKKQTINFVYTTLRTEGVDVNSEDVESAFKLLRKKRGEAIMNNKIIISSLMITGFNFLSEIGVNKKDLLKLHGIVMSYFEGKSPGQIRDDQRVIMRFNPKTLQQEEINYRPPTPQNVEKKFNKFFEWFNEDKNVHPLELAALAHLKLYLIHPFKDGNKRICRLLFNKILLDANYPMLNISKETSEYFKALLKSVEEKNEKFFVQFCYKTFIKQVKYRRLKR